MIITKKRAFSICSSLEIIKEIPALHSVYESIKVKNAEVLSKRGCSTCNANKLLAPLHDSAMNAIQSLGKEDLEKLKKKINVVDGLFAYVSNSEGVKLIPIE